MALYTSTAKPNPLGDYSSYNYQITLYSMAPDAYQSFVQSGSRNTAITNASGAPGLTIVAQSGGINNTTSTRASGFELDYYIDDLKIVTAYTPAAAGTNIVPSEIEFKIIEPYGFSFVSNLKRAKDQLENYSKTEGYKGVKNPYRGFFMLGIRFMGFDANGKVVIGQDNAQYAYEKFYGINITELKFKIDGKHTTYSIKAAPITEQVAYSNKRGVWSTGGPVSGSTVEEVCQDMIDKLNSQQQVQVANSNNNVKQINKYAIEFQGPKGQLIAKAKIVSSEDVDKFKFNMSGAQNTTETNQEASSKASVDTINRQIQFNSGTIILQAIEQIISQSTYVTQNLLRNYTTALQPNAAAAEPETVTNSGPTYLSWFNVASKITNPRYDDKIQDWAFDITYVVTPYETPNTLASSAGKVRPYYGPQKRYEYWYTGENREIVHYEQTFNQLFFTVAMNGQPNAGNTSTGGDSQVPVATNKPQPAVKLNKLGYGAEAINSYVTSLLDPGAWSEVKMTVLGDPDYLISTEVPPTPPPDEFYGPDGRTLNPRAGQMFVEINFYEAVDYNNTNGLMDVNRSIQFFDYAPQIQADLDSRGGGVIFIIKRVTSNFRGGKFTQELELTIAEALADPSPAAPEKQQEQQKAATITGLKPDN